jgi:hypothetical protein
MVAPSITPTVLKAFFNLRLASIASLSYMS